MSDYEVLKREMIPIGVTPSERRSYWNGYDAAIRRHTERKEGWGIQCAACGCDVYECPRCVNDTFISIRPDA